MSKENPENHCARVNSPFQRQDQTKPLAGVSRAYGWLALRPNAQFWAIPANL